MLLTGNLDIIKWTSLRVSLISGTMPCSSLTFEEVSRTSNTTSPTSLLIFVMLILIEYNNDLPYIQRCPFQSSDLCNHTHASISDMHKSKEAFSRSRFAKRCAMSCSFISAEKLFLRRLLFESAAPTYSNFLQDLAELICISNTRIQDRPNR